MRRSDVKRLIEWALNEEDGGGDGGGDWGGDWAFDTGYGGMGYGAGGGSMYGTFIQPFVDVFDTAASVVETGMSKVQLLVGIATYGIMDILIPWVKPQYEKMIEHDKRRMAQILRKHAATFERTDQALTEVGGDYDGAGIFFVLYPDAVIARNMVKLAGSGSEDTAKMAVDAAFDFIDTVTMNATGVVTDPIRKHFNFMEAYGRSGELITEDGDDKDMGEVKKLAAMAVKVMTSDKVQSLLNKSAQLKSLKQDGLEALEDTIKLAVEPIEKLKSVDNVMELESLTGGQLNIEDALHAKKADPDELGISNDEIEVAVKDVLPSLIEQAAQPFIKRLERLRTDLSKLASEYDVGGSSTQKMVDKLFDEALGKLKS